MSEEILNVLEAAIKEKLKAQIDILITRQFPEIERILLAEEEITLGLKVVITDRDGASGEHADKDNRIKSAISFTEKYTDSVDSTLIGDDHPELPLEDSKAWNRQVPQDEQPGGPGAEFLSGEGEGTKADLQPFEGAGQSNLGELLNAAAAGTELPRVKASLDGDDRKAIWKEFAHAARAAHWPAPCVKLMKESAEACDSTESLKTLLSAHITIDEQDPVSADPITDVAADHPAPAEDLQEADPALAQ